MNRRLTVLLPIIIAIVLALGIQIGLLLKNSKQTSLFSKSKLNTLEEVLDYVQAKYVDTVNVSTLQYGAISDVLEQLDPHSTFIPAIDLKGVNQELQGN